MPTVLIADDSPTLRRIVSTRHIVRSRLLGCCAFPLPMPQH